VVIRPVHVDEVGALASLAARTYAQTFGASMSAEDLAAQLKATRSEDYFRRVVGHDVVLVALIDGALAGYIQLSDVRIPVTDARSTDQELFALYVAPERQGRGIGKALMQAALGHERMRRAARIFLDVWDENVRAITLYTRFGFEPAGRRDFVVDGRVVGSDLVMVRSQNRLDPA
jgi:ribosomal protein S18 acetylase RimI-like enzyme